MLERVISNYFLFSYYGKIIMEWLKSDLLFINRIIFLVI